MKVECKRCGKSVDSRKAKADEWVFVEVSYLDGYKLIGYPMCPECYEEYKEFLQED